MASTPHTHPAPSTCGYFFLLLKFQRNKAIYIEKKACRNIRPQRAHLKCLLQTHMWKACSPGGSAIWEGDRNFKRRQLAGGSRSLEGHDFGIYLDSPFLSLCSLAAVRWTASATFSRCCDALPCLRFRKGIQPTKVWNYKLKCTFLLLNCFWQVLVSDEEV